MAIIWPDTSISCSHDFPPLMDYIPKLLVKVSPSFPKFLWSGIFITATRKIQWPHWTKNTEGGRAVPGTGVYGHRGGKGISRAETSWYWVWSHLAVSNWRRVPVVVWFWSCDKHHGQNHLRGIKKLFLLTRHSLSSREVKAGTWRRNHGGILWTGMLTFLLSYLFYVLKNTCPRSDAAHGGLCLPISVNNQDDPHRHCYRPIWSGLSFRLELMRTVSLWFPGAPWESHWLSLDPDTSN